MSLFDDLIRLGYSKGLHQLLKGRGPDCTYTGNPIYQVTFIVIIAVSLIVMLNYYYGIFNHPRFTHRRVWLANILTASGIAGFFAYFQTIVFLAEEKHCEQIYFGRLDCILFAFTAMIYTAIISVLFSLLFKWRSIANKKIPF